MIFILSGLYLTFYNIGETLIDNITGLLSSLDKEEQCVTTVFQENFVKFTTKLDSTKSMWRNLIKLQFKEMSPWLVHETEDSAPNVTPPSTTTTTTGASSSVLREDNFEYFSPLENENSKISCSAPNCKIKFGHKR